MAEEAKKTIEVLYKGRVETRDGKLGWILAKLDAPDDDLYYTFKKSPGLWGVGVYKVDVPAEQAEGSFVVYGNTFRWSRRWDDEVKAAVWETKSETAKSIVEAKKVGKKRANELDKLCQPLGRIYRSLSPFQREAFILYVVNEIKAQARSTVSMRDDDE